MAMASVDETPVSKPKPVPSVHANRPFTPTALPNQSPNKVGSAPNNQFHRNQYSARGKPKPAPRTSLPPAYRQQQIAFSYSSTIQEETSQGSGFRKLTNRFNKDVPFAQTQTATVSTPIAASTPSPASSHAFPVNVKPPTTRPNSIAPPPPAKPTTPAKPQYPPLFSYGYPPPEPKRPMTPSQQWNDKFATLCIGVDRIPVEFQLISKTHFCATAGDENPGFQPKTKVTGGRGRGRGRSGFTQRSSSSSANTRGVNPIREKKNTLFAELFCTIPGATKGTPLLLISIILRIY